MPLFGDVTGIALNRGFGFVQYEQENSAMEAIKQENGAVYRGKKMGGFCIKRNNFILCSVELLQPFVTKSISK